MRALAAHGEREKAEHIAARFRRQHSQSLLLPAVDAAPVSQPWQVGDGEAAQLEVTDSTGYAQMYVSGWFSKPAVFGGTTLMPQGGQSLRLEAERAVGR